MPAVCADHKCRGLVVDSAVRVECQVPGWQHTLIINYGCFVTVPMPKVGYIMCLADVFQCMHAMERADFHSDSDNIISDFSSADDGVAVTSFHGTQTIGSRVGRSSNVPWWVAA